MNILIISPIFPYPLKTGGHTRLYNVLKYVASRHTVDFISPIKEKDKKNVEKIAQFCRKFVAVNIEDIVLLNRRNIIKRESLKRINYRILRLMEGIPLEVSGFYYNEMQDKINELIKSNKYDVVQLEMTRMTQYFNREFFNSYPSLKVLVDYDLSFVPHQRRYQCEKKLHNKPIRYLDYKIHRSYALKNWKLFDKIVVMSEIDKKKILNIFPDLCIYVVPNGVDINYYRPPENKDAKEKILFIGGAEHYANVDSLQYFLKDIFQKVKKQLNKIELTVIGEGWEAYYGKIEKDANVRFVGYVEDIRPYANEAVVMVAPIRIGGGTRLKILEAMAMGVPVVSTTVGCEGIPVEDGRNISLDDTADGFVNKIIDLYNDHELSKRIADCAYKLVKEKYGWDKLSIEMEKVYEDAVNTR